jgi:hypothetical protein
MTILEVVYDPRTLKTRCYECKWLERLNGEFGDWFYGTCVCKTNKIKNRKRTILDRKCTKKEYNKF